MNSKQLGFFPLVFIVVFFDQLGKLYVVNSLPAGGRVQLIGGVVSFAHSPTAGGAFGLFSSWTPVAQLIGFVFLFVIVAFVVASFYRGLAPREFGSAVGLGAILGGTISNTFDRLRFGSGLDFLHFGSASVDTLPDLNLADIAIVLGVVTLIVELLATEIAARASERPRD